MKIAYGFMLGAVILAASGSTLHAQRPGTLTLANGGLAVPCPANDSFYSGMTCYYASVDGCNDYLGNPIASIDLYFGIAKPIRNPSGVIVLHAGSGGTAPLNMPGTTNDFASDFVQAGFVVVQVAWMQDWESLGNGDFDVKGAACRPATFFDYIYQTYVASAQHKPAFCLLGSSAGAGAVGMYLAHYNGGAAVDKAEMWAGPQFADLKQGCEVLNDDTGAPAVTDCPNGGGTYPCSSAHITPWTYRPAYSNSEVAGWVGGGSACTGSKPTSGTQNALWLNMSIVDQMSDASFNYPNTNISAYLCSYGFDGGNGGTAVNPSSQQGWIFYSQIGMNNVGRLDLHSATCWELLGSTTPSPEEVYYASAIDNLSVPPYFGSASCAHASYSVGYAALCNDMINSCLSIY